MELVEGIGFPCSWVFWDKGIEQSCAGCKREFKKDGWLKEPCHSGARNGLHNIKGMKDKYKS